MTSAWLIVPDASSDGRNRPAVSAKSAASPCAHIPVPVLVLVTEPVDVVIVDPVIDAPQKSYSWPVAVSTTVRCASVPSSGWRPAGT